MLRDSLNRSGLVLVPEDEGVVVPTTRELTPVEGPLQTTDFLLVSEELCNVVLWHSHVAV
jgi:hypothetical protein